MKLFIAFLMLLAAGYSQAQTATSNAAVTRARNTYNDRITAAQTTITAAEKTYQEQVAAKVKLEEELATLRREYDDKQKKWNDSAGGIMGYGRGTGNPEYEKDWVDVYNRYNALEKRVNDARAAVEGRQGHAQGQAYKDIVAARQAHADLVKAQGEEGTRVQREFTLLQTQMDAVQLQSNFTQLLTDITSTKHAMEHNNNKYEQTKLGFLIKSQIAQTMTSEIFCKASKQCNTPTDKPKLSDDELMNMLKNKSNSSSSILNSGGSR